MTKISTMSRNEWFVIEVVDDQAKVVSGVPVQAMSRIVVNDFEEHFIMSLDYWTVDHYRASWREALRVLVTGESPVSCLITSITDPKNSNFVFCWPLYRETGKVFVQNKVLFLDELAGGFSVESPWKALGPREVVNEDGDRISEWTTGVLAVERFLTAMS